MELISAITIGIGLLLIGILFLVLSLSWVRKDAVSQRVETYVGEDENQLKKIETSLAARSMEFRGTFLERTLYPFLRQIGNLFGNLMPARRMEKLNRQLSLIGNPFGLRAREFWGLQLAIAIGGFILAYLVYQTEYPNVIWLSILIVTFALLVPILLLNRSVRKNQNEIRKELPNVIDMLSICTSAGLSFDQSLQRVSDEWRTRLSWEFGRVVSEMEMGLTRRDALRNLADRLEVDELSTFVSIIIQSDQLGMSISNTLHTLAQQMRLEWRFRAQEEARKLPVKILIPLVFFIFPAMLAVILGPSIPSLIGLMNTIN